MHTLPTKDIEAICNLSPAAQALIYYACKGLENECNRNAKILQQDKKLTPELLDYYTAIATLSESVSMAIAAVNNNISLSQYIK